MWDGYREFSRMDLASSCEYIHFPFGFVSPPWKFDLTQGNEMLVSTENLNKSSSLERMRGPRGKRIYSEERTVT